MKKVFAIIFLSLSLYSSSAQINQGKISRSGAKKPVISTGIENRNAGFPLAGTWILKATEVILPDGKHATDTAYGKHAKGKLFIDPEGQYSLQIFRPDRPKFASGDKRRGTPEEYQAALLGISTHMGQIKMDTANKILQFNIDYGAYPNWDNTSQTRKFTLTGDVLYYEVPAKAAAGTIAVSIWERKKK